jgi:hypothetical protein
MSAFELNRRKLMTTKMKVTMATIVLAMCTLFAPGAKAECGSLSRGAKMFQSQNLLTAVKIQQADAANDPTPAGASIVGLWEIENINSATGRVSLHGIDAWHSDGTETLNDTGNPSGGNVCLGVWVKSGPNAYKLRHPYWRWDATGTLIGSGVLRFEVTVDPDGNSFTGTFTNDQFDLAGNNVHHGAGTTHGQRITVDF